MNVWLYKKLVRRRPKWCVDYSENGKRRQLFFVSKAVAEGRASELRRGMLSARSWWTALPATERDRIVQACHDAHEREHDVVDLLSRAQEFKPSLGPTLGETITELLGAKRNAGRSSDYTDALELMLNKFARGRESVKIGALNVADVEKFLDAGTIASRSTRRARVSTLFKFAVRRGYRADNPCERVESVTYVKPRPKVFTAAAFTTAVAWLRQHAPHGLAWFALSTVCGLRPEEAEKTTRKDINFEEGFVRVEAQTTKVRERRIVYPRAEAMTFLKWAIKRGGQLPLSSQSRSRFISGQIRKTRKGKRRSRSLREAMGWSTWPKDITRHTAASYWLSADGSAAHVAEMLGNSESVLKRDYKALVTRSDAQSFWLTVQRLTTNRKKTEK